MSTLEELFKEKFDIGLKDYGFIRVRNSTLYVKLVNGEILQFITLQRKPALIRGYKEFLIASGIRTIYARSLDKKELLYRAFDLLSYDRSKKDYQYSYNDNNMEALVEKSLNDTLNIIPKTFENVVNLDSYIEFCKKYNSSLLSGGEFFAEDSLVLIQADNHDDFINLLNERYTKSVSLIKTGKMGGTYEERYKLLYRGIVKSIALSRDKVYNNPELYSQAKEELARRKELNLKTLRRYGFDV